MNKSTVLQFILLSGLYFGLSSSAFSVVYFANDFESGTQPPDGTPMPQWTLPPVFGDAYGDRNFFFVTDSTAHTGNFSLRISYNGRNGVCNTCGSTAVRHKAGLDGVDYFVADTDEDLTFRDVNEGPGAKPGATVFNKTGGYSKWQITSIGNEGAVRNKLSLKLLSSSIDGSPDVFNSGDTALIARTCGVDGKIGFTRGGPAINKRVDCNTLVSWFGNIQAQTPGTSIFRRQYLKQETSTRVEHQKLHYFRPNRDKTKGTVRGEAVLLAAQGKPLDSLGLNAPYPRTGLRHFGGKLSYEPSFGLPVISFERGQWFYLEEEYKASTFNTSTGEYNPDGEYRLWFAKSGQETDTPVLDERGLTLPALSGGGGTHMSLWGNQQHDDHLVGNWYMDDIEISDTRIGWIANPVSSNTQPPSPPPIP